jgi:hypothetical protein
MRSKKCSRRWPEPKDTHTKDNQRIFQAAGIPGGGLPGDHGVWQVVFGSVVLRFGFNSGTSISDEMSRYCLFWLTYLGTMVAMREKGHLGVDTLVRRLPLGGKNCVSF